MNAAVIKYLYGIHDDLLAYILRLTTTGVDTEAALRIELRLDELQEFIETSDDQELLMILPTVEDALEDTTPDTLLTLVKELNSIGIGYD